MAWQSPSAMGGNGGAGGGGDGNNNNVNGGQPHGTEYTLQGVMRFLQTEWHRHERDRNAWEIERAEMKAKIAKLEGETRSHKKLQVDLSKRIQMLEIVLKREREKAKSVNLEGGAPKEDEGKDPGKQDSKPNVKTHAEPIRPAQPKQYNSPLDVVSEDPSPFRQESQRQKSRIYLERCLQEITYLLTPPLHPPPQHQSQLNPQDAATGQGYSQSQLSQAMEDSFPQQQRQKLQQHAGPGLSQPSQTQGSQPLQAPVSDNSNLGLSMIKGHQIPQLSRNLANQQPLPQGSPLSLIDNLPQSQPQPQITIPSAPDDPVERVTHSYDAFGRVISGSQEDARANRGVVEEPVNAVSGADSDSWDFSDASAALDPERDTAPPPPQRPDIEVFPNANHVTAKSPPRSGPGSHRRKGSMSRRRSGDGSQELRESALSQSSSHMKAESFSFKVRFALRGHLDVVRAVIFTGGGSPPEPEICTGGDDGVIKRWIIPASYGSFGGSMGNNISNDLDIQSNFTHRGHTGVVTSLAAYPSAENFSGGGRAPGDGWVFSGGQDATVRVWERGRVDPKATLYGHTDAVWAVCVLPSSAATVFGNDGFAADRILLASGAADGTVRIWAVSAPPQLSPAHAGSRRGLSGSRRHSISSGSGFPSSPQPSMATTTPFNYSLIHTITRQGIPASPTRITPLSGTGDTFIVSYTDASVIIFDTRTAEEVVGMASLETYDRTPATGVNAIVATTVGLDSSLSLDCGRALAEEDGVVHGATGLKGGVEGVVISGHEDRYIRFFDANSGQCTYTMLAHPSAISSLSLSPDGRELVSGGHDASLRFWSLEKRSCTQEITSHRLMRGEGVCDVVWSQDGRWVVSAGGDGVVKVFAR
ncbi:hypothetical protein FGG08_007255 [Glutinoglossum americanum]|uniref:Striatin N-terminal domain-containing protein n=1 Tax=Glutinoglossum americanum TaxID=1670608 RepID=A0A9P8KWM7_9PEZI|nr:hypothetical protein FGG08_007255 [Glutinoglossum americanum]